MDFCSKHRITKATVGGGGGEWWQTTIRGVEPKLGPIRRERWEQLKIEGPIISLTKLLMAVMRLKLKSLANVTIYGKIFYLYNYECDINVSGKIVIFLIHV